MTNNLFRITESAPVHTTFGVETRADYLVDYFSQEGLLAIVKMVQDGKLKKPLLHIGAGSNILFTKDFHGTILHSSIGGISVIYRDEKSVHVKVGAGIIWDDFVAYCVEQKWFGVENLSLIPGEVGASAVQNIGAYGVEVKDIIESVETIDIESGLRRVFMKNECDYSYRYSIFKGAENKRYIVTDVVYRLGLEEHFNLSYGNLGEKIGSSSPTLSSIRQAIIDMRNQKLPDPSQIGSAGSFFMNPIVSKSKLEELLLQYPAIPSYPAPADEQLIKLSAGWLIEQCGWKGKSLGRAGVYAKQALVIVNHGGANGAEIVAVMEAVISSVEEKFGISLKPEVNII